MSFFTLLYQMNIAEPLKQMSRGSKRVYVNNFGIAHMLNYKFLMKHIENIDIVEV